MPAKKTTGKKTVKVAVTRSTAKTTARKTTTEEPAPIATSQKSCAYPSCSARATQEHGDKKVPSCDTHAETFETQAEDGAGIQQLIANYRG